MQRSWPTRHEARQARACVAAREPHFTLHQLSISILHCHHSSKNKSADSEASLIHLGSGCSASQLPVNLSSSYFIYLSHARLIEKNSHQRAHGAAHRCFYRKPPLVFLSRLCRRALVMISAFCFSSCLSSFCLRREKRSVRSGK